MFKDQVDQKVLNEYNETFGRPTSSMGVFPLSGKWENEKSIGVIFRPGLAAFRSNHLVLEVLNSPCASSGQWKILMVSKFGSPFPNRRWLADRNAKSEANARLPAVTLEHVDELYKF